MRVETLGVWLTASFTYIEGSSNLEYDRDEPYYSEPVIEPHAGGQAVVWSFSSVPFADFPSVDPRYSLMTSDITLQFASSQSGRSPEAVSWITTSGVSDIPFPGMLTLKFTGLPL